MSNFKVTEDYVFNLIQTHDFKVYIKDLIERTKSVIDESYNDEQLKNRDKLLSSIDKSHLDSILEGKSKNIVDKVIYKEFLLMRSKETIKNIWTLFLEKDIRKMVLTEKCLELISTMKMDKSIRYDFLRTLPNRTDLISLDKNNCVVYKKTDDRVLVIFCISNRSDVDSFNINKRFVDIDLINETHYSSNVVDVDDMNDELSVLIYTRFVQIVSFIELGNTNFKIVPPKDKVGNFLKDNECRNLTKKEFIVVDTDWNDISIRMEGFPVKGHLRLQRCGVGRSDFKVIYIQPFMKHGYNRNHLKNGVDVENVEFEEMEKV